MPNWMAFNVDDYVSNTMHLTTRQHGAYILLICAAWKAKGCLPGSDAALMAIAKLTPKEWREDGDCLKAFLTRRNDGWVHERVEFEWKDAQSLIEAKSRAGREGARKRWNGRRNGSAMPEPKQPQRHPDAPVPLPEPPSASNNHTVANSAPVGASAQGRARHIPEDWEPSADNIAALRKSRPDLTGSYYDERMGAFRRWCKAKSVWTHDEATTWLDFMLGSYVRDNTGRRGAGPMKSDLPPQDPWEKRVSDFHKDGFWLASQWGPKPGEYGCRVPAHLLRSAA